MTNCNMTINNGATSALAHLVHNILVNWKTSLKINMIMASQFILTSQSLMGPKYHLGDDWRPFTNHISYDFMIEVNA